MSRSFPHFPAFALFLATFAFGASLPAPSAAQQPAPAAQENSPKVPGKIPPFLILGTVFTEKNYAFAGVRVRIRRKGEKKFRYDMYTNSRGEFAVRVPDGIEYEVVVGQKKYKEQSQEVAAKAEDVQQRLTFRMEPVGPAKSGDAK